MIETGQIGNIYKVVVVDDEPMAVKAICKIIEKYCPQFLVVGAAKEGKEALEVIRETSPDLVLTDIDMPLMNGLELIKAAKALMPDLCFVIISGYQDFEYVRDAIRSGVLDYLTKPIVPSQMRPTMERVDDKLRKFYYDCRNAILRRLCLGENVAQEEICKFFPYEQFYAALLRENGLPRRFSLSKELEIYGTIDEAYSIYGRDSMEELFLIPKEILGEQPIIDYMTKVEQRQKTEGSYMTLLYYGTAFPVSEISEKIHNLYYWLNALSTVGLSQTVDLNKKKQIAGRLPMPDTSEISLLLQELEKYTKIGGLHHLQKGIEKAFAQWEQEKRPQLWVEHAVHRILNFIRMHTSDEASLVESEYQLEDAFYYATSMKMLGQSCYHLFYRPGYEEKETLKVDSPEFFEKIEKYIRKHLSQPLSLSELSDYFAISQAYMSKLFRKYTGQSYNQYLTSIRMEKAKQMLEENEELYIRDIAEMVGYRDQFYFSRIFRSYTGKRPADYQHRRE